MPKTSSKSIHFVGVGGIGMSGLAQLMLALGWDVSGSDRALSNPENESIIAPLRAQGVRLFPQDGSRYTEGFPDFIVYSTAIEADNPDFTAAPDVPKIHRSECLQNALAQWNAPMRIAVMGSAGKTTVSAWLGETLAQLEGKPTILSGGRLNAFSTETCVGNFVKGEGPFFVFEADESDKSVLRYHPEVSLILNIGTDHYSREELIEVFAQCLRQTQKIAILDASVKALLPSDCMNHLKVYTFSITDKNADFALLGYKTGVQNSEMVFQSPDGIIEMPLPLWGIHNASNALVILATVKSLGIDATVATRAVNHFHGVWRRFDDCGTLANGARVFDDYAHNVEKIQSALQTTEECMPSEGRRIAIFQPHGFGPLKFMRTELIQMFLKTLKNDDILMMMPVYYAGGTSSFSPTSAEVIAELQAHAPPFIATAPNSRDEVEAFLSAHARSNDIVLIMGARDNSLSLWAKKMGNRE